MKNSNRSFKLARVLVIAPLAGPLPRSAFAVMPVLEPVLTMSAVTRTRGMIGLIRTRAVTGLRIRITPFIAYLAALHLSCFMHTNTNSSIKSLSDLLLETFRFDK